jgi:hypothetical protein
MPGWRRAAAFGAALLTTACATGHPVADPSDGGPGSDVKQRVMAQARQSSRGGMVDLDTQSSEVDLWGRDHHPTLYAGTDVDRDRHILLVYRRPSTSFDDDLRRAFPGTLIETVSAPASVAELDGLIAQVFADANYWASRRIHIAGAAPDFMAGTVVVNTPQADAARLMFPAHYGDRIVVEEGNAIPASFSAKRDNGTSH